MVSTSPAAKRKRIKIPKRVFISRSPYMRSSGRLFHA
jgi:hypothetical protein